MRWIRDIYDHMHRLIGRTTIGKLLVAFLLFLVPIILFTWLADEVIEGDTTQIDNSILLAINERSTPLMNHIVYWTTDLGGTIGIAIIGILLISYFIKRSMWVACVQLAAGIGGAGILNFTLKLIFERDRPDLWEHLVFENSYSFPSGHAMLSSALALSLILILWHTKARWYVVAGSCLYIGYIGFTRLYLGVHYPSDIIAGWCVSLAWVVTVAIILGTIKLPRQFTRKL